MKAPKAPSAWAARPAGTPSTAVTTPPTASEAKALSMTPSPSQSAPQHHVHAEAASSVPSTPAPVHQHQKA